MLVDLRRLGISGAEAERRLSSINIIANKNAIPFDTSNKTLTSGLRLGTPAVTSRGLTEKDMEILGDIISEALLNDFNADTEARLKKRVLKLTKKFPLK